MVSKRTNNPTRIIARSLTIVDAEGKARIHLDADKKSGYASISLLGKKGGSIEICEQPNGTFLIALTGQHCHAALTLNSVGDSELSLTDREGRQGLKLGSVFDPGRQQIVLFEEGQIAFQMPKSKRNRRPGR